MNAGTPRDRRGSQLLRTTDYARILLRRAQLALAALAVAVSITVGTVVAATVPVPSEPVSAPALAALRTTSDLLIRVELLPASPGTVGALARAEEIAGRLGPDRRSVHGVLAGLITLGGCWMLLGAAGAIWRRRLARRDLHDWTDGWARVEPLWSDRIT